MDIKKQERHEFLSWFFETTDYENLYSIDEMCTIRDCYDKAINADLEDHEDRFLYFKKLLHDAGIEVDD